MKTLYALVLLLTCSLAQALEPYYPSPYADRSWFFSGPSMCAGGPEFGTCRYYGYARNSGGYANVTWDENGIPLSATPCHLYAWQSTPAALCVAVPK